MAYYGSDLYVRVWGEGERVLLIHGGNTEDPGIIWSRQRSLANRYQLIVPDRRGYGHSPGRPDSWSYQHDVEDMATLLGDGAHLVGFSAGGLIALLLAERYPALIRSLTVIEPPAFIIIDGCGEVDRVVEALRPVFQTSTTHEDFLLGFMRALGLNIAEPVSLSVQQRKGVEAMMKETEPWKIPVALEALAQLTCPKLVVSGDWHRAFIITANKLAQSIGAKRLLIEGATHAAQGTGKLFNEQLEAIMKSA